MGIKENDVVAAVGEKSKKYVAPKLSVYGSVTQLTAAGVSGVPEAQSSSGNKLAPLP